MLVAVCDDCMKDRQKIKDLLLQYSEQKNQDTEIAEYVSAAALCEDKEVLGRCSILFLNIGKETARDLQAAKKIKTLYPHIQLVLVTAFLSYALEGYKVKASQCLLKETLTETFAECMDTILEELGQKQNIFQFPFVEGSVKLAASQIIYVETEGHKNVFHTTDAAYSLYRKLDEIEKELQASGFVRIHRSFLVNMQYIERLSSYVLQLSTGQELSVPKTRYAHVKREYALYKGT